MKIFHNPRCRKSREGLSILEAKGIDFEVIKYLDTPPTFDELKDIILKLKMKPFDLIRRTEAIYKENFKGKDLSDDEWIQIMVDYPKLIERPIVITKNSAVLGRPPERIKDIF